MNYSAIPGGKRLLGMGMLATALLALPAALLRADDTELYFNPAPPDAPAPLVMLTLDWRSNLGNTFCVRKGDASCIEKFGTDDIGTQIYSQLDMSDADGVADFDAFRAVFKAIFDSDVADGTRVGFMMNHNNDNNCTTGNTRCSNGGYVLRGFELFEAGDANGAKAELLQIMKDIPLPQGGLAHPYQGLELFFEMYRYLTGLEVVNGKLGSTDFDSAVTTRNLDHEFAVGGSPDGPPNCVFSKTSITGDNRQCLDYINAGDVYSIADDSNYRKVSKVNGDCPLGSTPVGGSCYVRISSALTWDPDIITTSDSTDRYISPYNDDEDWSCSGAYSINLLFQVSQQDADSNSAITQTLPNQGLREWGLQSNPSLTFTNIISKLHQNDHAAGQAAGVPTVDGIQNLTSYFLVDGEHENKTTNGYASAGGTGNAIAALDDPRALFEALTNIFSQINSASSTFVAVTVPVNADNRVTSLPNMFVALFQADETGKPLWPGNVKKLDVVTTTLDDGSKQLDVLDALGKPAFNPITGRIDDNALTLWTDPTAADVLAADDSKGEVPGRDGSSVRRGGAGHKIPSYRDDNVSVGETNSEDGARQIFLGPETVNGLAAAGNALVALDASADSGALRENEDVQTRFGFRDTTATCGDEPPDSTFCLSAIRKVLDAANIPYPEPSPDLSDADKETMAQEATQALLRWIRGFDVFDADNDNDPEETRPWLMGDVLHSRPVAINYGARLTSGTDYSKDNQDVRLVFGSNDGLLRMVRNTLPGSSAPPAVTQQDDEYGEEVWAFMPREVLSHVPRLAMTTGNVGVNRPYGVDGEPTLFTIDTNRDGIINSGRKTTLVMDPVTGEPAVDPATGEPILTESVVDCYSAAGVGDDGCDRAWVYFGLRRGGKSYYAIDVSNPDAALPKLLWKIDDSMADFTELGLTFSTPRVGWVRFEDDPANQFNDPDDEPDQGDFNVPVPVVIVGGGYHGHAVSSGDHHQSGTGGPSKDTILGTPFTGLDTDEGNAVFIVHARTGELIWKVTGTGAVSATESVHASMEHGIAAPVSPMDADGDGILDRLYVPDTGGRVWRIDIPQYVPDVSPGNHRAVNWKASVLADLRPADAALALSTDNDLRFFHGATLVRRARDAIGEYDAIALGSGDRAHPQSETNKNNWFFLFKDRLTTSGDPAVAVRTPLAPTDLLNTTDICLNVTGGVPCTGDLSHGWRLALEENGEKNLSSPFIGGNGIIFTTYLPEGSGPDDDPCVPLGTSRLYQVGLAAGEPLRFLHGVTGNTFSKTDRWIELYEGIDGGVVAVSPDFAITSSGKPIENPPQKPVQFYWREGGVDAVQ